MILAVAEQLRSSWNIHIEVTLQLHRAINDDADQIRALSSWMIRALGSLTPLHLLLAPGTQPDRAVEAAQVAHDTGLKFVYGPAAVSADPLPQLHLGRDPALGRPDRYAGRNQRPVRKLRHTAGPADLAVSAPDGL